MSQYLKLMEKQAAEERAAEKLAAETVAPAVPGPSAEVNPARPAAMAEPPAYRPQPFTPDLIPEPKEIEAEGELTPEETGDLANCEKAFAYADQAEWMRGKAAHAVRSRRLYRSGGRLWPEYCEEILGESESEVNRRIQQWQLARAIFQLWTRPTPASHIQALLPAVKAYGEEQLARGYVELRGWAAQNGTRVTAADLAGWVKKARSAVKEKTAPPALTGQTLAQVREDRERQPVRAVVRKQLPEPRKVAAEHAGSGPQENASMLNHPNLGDSTLNDEAVAVPSATGGDEDTEDRGIRAWTALEVLAADLTDAGVLRGASTATLTAIERTARGLADAAAEILRER
ncbi:hypothetical protein [Streptomyces chryseus]|uniref:Uncharacterized protein n=1 Tax=Streptomyces chryseus TaxID=68186 RepID=A0ABQ3EA12_9ACTN|nr:hypothetical protein [Streptomyces chryseus]GHB31222.1 hypothetical protein GCM10010346_63290 [Streptomyces chryseus]